MSASLLGAVVACLVLAGSAQADTVFVDDDAAGGVGCGALALPCKTIQQGVDVAVAGDTVSVAAGIYEEQVDIAEAIAIQGAGRDQTTILSPPIASLLDKFDRLTTDHRPIVYAHDLAAPLGVDISALTIDGDNRGGVPCTPNFHAIAYVNAGGSVDDVRATGITSTPFSGCQVGRAIVNYNIDTNPRTWTVSNSTIDDFQKDAIEVRNPGLTATISGNEVIGRGAQNQIAQNGIVVQNPALVEGNDIRDLLCNEPSCGSNVVTQASSSAILTSAGSAGAEITDNDVTNSDVAVSDAAIGAARSVHDNRLIGNRYAGVLNSNGQIAINDNLISGSDSGIFGVSFEANPTDFVSHITGSGNQILSNDTGIRLFENNPSADNASIEISASRIFGNGVGADNDGDTTLDLENNWWGCNAGPSDPDCDSAEGLIDFDPWLIMGISAIPSSINVTQTSQVLASFVRNSDGQDVGQDFPDAVDVAFAADLGSIDTPNPTASGVAESEFDPGDATGTATLSATLDNQTVQTAVTVSAAPSGNPAAGQGEPGPDCSTAVRGTNRRDLLIGTAVGDRLLGLRGRDRLRGRSGRDCLKGGRGRDLVGGGAMADELRGGRGVDRIRGGRGADRIRGNRNGDNISGQRGNDRIRGGSGRDRVHGGPGRDLIRVRDHFEDRVQCGSGADTVVADPDDDVAGNCERVRRG